MDFLLPELGEGLYEAELIAWLVKPGDTVKRGQDLMEVMTDKATAPVPAPFGGTINELRAAPGDTIKVGQVMLTYTPAGQQAEPAAAAAQGNTEKKTAAAQAEAPRPVPSRQGGNGPSRLAVKAAPSVRYMARKLGIDLAQVHGSGPAGRILIDDLSSHVRRAAPDEKRPAAEPRPDYGTPGTRVKLAGLRRKIAERMVHSKRTIPHYSYVDECDVTDLVRLRDGLKDAAARVGAKVTYLAFVVKAVVAALKEVPVVNATLDEEAGEIVLHDRYDVGIAVAAPGGLIVPVLRQADRKDLFQLAREIERLSNDARAGRSKLEDLRGSTFTVTSIGNVGGLFSTPIINHPEVGILGVGKIVKRPVFDAAGNVRPAEMVYLSFSFDHRVVDGAVGAAFGNAVLRHLHSPAALLVPVS
jgi:pyruvate dehydrogenase E2 component (dihydrolipoamide acetyltransferase)/2-oxoisovalerate dehydrogenase E2 component (dihydrolipoyl transacylase)